MPLKQRKVEDDAESSSSSDEGSDQDMEETGYTGNEVRYAFSLQSI